MAGDKVLFQHSRYLGGLSGDKGGYGGNLIVDSEGIGCGVTNKKKGVVLWQDASGISYDSEQIAKSRVGKAMLVGVFALAAKNTQAAATITVTLRVGGAAVYQVAGKTGPAVRGRIQAFVLAAGVPCLDDLPSESIERASVNDHSPRAPLSVADELVKLVALRDAGVLTDDELSAQKAKLLGS